MHFSLCLSLSFTARRHTTHARVLVWERRPREVTPRRRRGLRNARQGRLVCQEWASSWFIALLHLASHAHLHMLEYVTAVASIVLFPASYPSEVLYWLLSPKCIGAPLTPLSLTFQLQLLSSLLFNRRPLNYAAFGGRIDAAKLLVSDRGASTDLKDKRSTISEDLVSYLFEYEGSRQRHGEVVSFLEAYEPTVT